MGDYRTIYGEKATVKDIEPFDKDEVNGFKVSFGKPVYHVCLHTDSGYIDSYFTDVEPNKIALGDRCNPNLVTSNVRNGDNEYQVVCLNTDYDEVDEYVITLLSKGRVYLITTTDSHTAKKFKYGDILYGNLDFIR